MSDVLAWIDGWFWWIAALLLFLADLHAPGVLFLWLGLGALAVAMTGLVVTLGPAAQIILFALFSVLLLLLAKPRLQAWQRRRSDETRLNDRPHSYIGQVHHLAEPITQGRGFLTIDDTRWVVTGPDLPQGTPVRITGVDGPRLMVRPAD